MADPIPFFDIQAGAIIEMPELMVKTDRFLRFYNRTLKEAVRHSLKQHHRKRMKYHFQRGNRQRYNHYKRSRRTKQAKGHRSVDLVDSKETKIHMLSHIQAGPYAGGKISRTGGVIKGSMKFRFPFKVNLSKERNAHPLAVTVYKMAQEIERFDQRDADDSAREVRDYYLRALNVHLNSKKVRKRVGGKRGRAA